MGQLIAPYKNGNVMTTKVFFYLLNERFVENDEQVPEQAKQVMYYSLAIGHHVGVIDCFKKLLVCDYDAYQRFVDSFPEGDAKRKFAGLMRFGEIVIDSSHVNLLAKAMDENKANFNPRTSRVGRNSDGYISIDSA